MDTSLHAVILAASSGSRMGHVPKCLIHAEGRTLLDRLLGAMEPLQASATALVLGTHAPAIKQAMATWPLARGIRCVTNETPEESPAGSLRLALRALPGGGAHPVMVLLADQPLLTAHDLAAVWLAYQSRASGTEVLWPAVKGQPGHPVVISPGVAQVLREHTVDSLKQWRQRHPATVADWLSSNPAHTFDLDTPEDLQVLSKATHLDWHLPGSGDAEPG